MPTQCDLYRKTAEERFEAYHSENPQVFAKFVSFAEQLKAAGRSRIGAKAIIERIRWDSMIAAKGDEFKVNNSYTSRYVRLLATSRPDLATMFATRKLKS